MKGSSWWAQPWQVMIASSDRGCPCRYSLTNPLSMVHDNGNYPAFNTGPQEGENGLLRDGGNRHMTSTITCRFLG